MSDDSYASKLLIVLLQNSTTLTKGYDRLPLDAKILYDKAANDLATTITLLSSSTTEDETESLKLNLNHIKSTLDSLDSIAKIRMYKHTIYILKKILLIAVKVAISTI